MHGSTQLQEEKGFTLIELVFVILLLGILTAFALPRFANLENEARIQVLQGVAGAMRSTAGVVRSKALAQGLVVAPANPGNQAAYVVNSEAGSAEVDWRNLCPESRAELGDRLEMVDFIDLSTSAGLTSLLNNRYTLIGYDIPGFSVPTNQGCYVIYDSFGDPSCTVTVVTADCDSV